MPKDGVDMRKDFPHSRKDGFTPYYTAENAQYAEDALDKMMFCICTAGLDKNDNNRFNMTISCEENGAFAKVFILNKSSEAEARENWEAFVSELEENGFTVVKFTDEEMQEML